MTLRDEPTLDSMRAALHQAGIGCKPNVPGCRSTHRGHAERLIRALKLREPEPHEHGPLTWTDAGWQCDVCSFVPVVVLP